MLRMSLNFAHNSIPLTKLLSEHYYYEIDLSISSFSSQFLFAGVYMHYARRRIQIVVPRKLTRCDLDVLYILSKFLSTGN